MPMTAWNLYRFQIAISRPVRAVQMALRGVDYYRCLEYPLVWNALEPGPGSDLLDVGVGDGFFSLFLARSGARVLATDIDAAALDRLRRVASQQSWLPSTFRIEQQDARRFTYPPESFDRIACVSTIEHIRGDGDSLAMCEMARVLRPKGRLVLTVPFSPVLEEHEASPHVPYYERRYDEAALRSRLIDPSGLRVATLYYFGEPSVRFHRAWYRLPWAIRKLLGWALPGAAAWFLRVSPTLPIKNRDGALLVLEKP